MEGAHLPRRAAHPGAGTNSQADASLAPGRAGIESAHQGLVWLSRLRYVSRQGLNAALRAVRGYSEG